jgi:hypothetical protein
MESNTKSIRANTPIAPMAIEVALFLQALDVKKLFIA